MILKSLQARKVRYAISTMTKNSRHTKLSYIQGAAKKSSPLKFFAVFSATAWNFNMEFYRFIYRNVLHLTAK